MTDDHSLLAGTALEDDAAVEPKLRPQVLAEYIGQNKVRENLSVFLAAAKGRGEPLDHVLLTGPPGLGQDDARPHRRPGDGGRAAPDGGPDDRARRRPRRAS